MLLPETIKILVLEDEFIIAQDIVEIISLIGYTTAKIANTYTEAEQITKDWIPDLVLLDINLESEKTGIDFLLKLQKRANINVIFISSIKDEETINQAKLTFPINYLFKPFDEKQLKLTLDLAINAISVKNTSVYLNKLSHSEIKVVQYISRGHTSKEIAEILFVSEKTIRNHRYNISKKLNLSPEKNSLLKWAMNNLL